MATKPYDEGPDAFLEGTISLAEETARALAALRAQCPDCDRILTAQEIARRERFWTDPARWPALGSPLPPDRRRPENPGSSRARGPAAVARRQALADLERLRQAEESEFESLLGRARESFIRPELVPLVLAEGREQIGAAPASALAWFSVAVSIALSLPETPANARLLLRAHAERANALRALGRLPEAEALWPRIERALADLPLDGPGEEGAVWSLQASQRIAQRDFLAASRLLDRAERLYRLGGDRAGVTKVFTKRGTAADLAGDPGSAVHWHLRAAERIDPDAEPRLFWITQNNLADSLVSLGEAAEAAQVLVRSDAIYRRVKDPGLQLRRTWVEALIAASLGRTPEAETKLWTVLAESKTQRRAYDYALVQLDLARLYLAHGADARVREVAAALAPALRAKRVPAVMVEALTLFRDAALAGRADAALVAEVRRYLPLARRDPGYAFRRGEVLEPPPPPSEP